MSAAANVDDGKCRRKLFVGQLPSHISEQHLRPVFAKFGRVVQLKVKRDPDTGNGECVLKRFRLAPSDPVAFFVRIKTIRVM